MSKARLNPAEVMSFFKILTQGSSLTIQIFQTFLLTNLLDVALTIEHGDEPLAGLSCLLVLLPDDGGVHGDGCIVPGEFMPAILLLQIIS